MTEHLKNISQPALVIAGQEDRTMPMEVMRALASRLPHAAFKIVADVGHYCQLERPGHFNADLRAVVAQLQA